jgi:hypothetical protein
LSRNDSDQQSYVVDSAVLPKPAACRQA